jgi:hypothetical protein
VQEGADTPATNSLEALRLSSERERRRHSHDPPPAHEQGPQGSHAFIAKHAGCVSRETGRPRGSGSAFSVAFPSDETYNASDPAGTKEEAMKGVAFYLLAASALLAEVFAVSGCESTAKIANAPPANLTLTASKCFIEAGGRVHLSGTATDDDGDPLTFRWSATAGTFDPASGIGASLDWIAPSTPGTATITLTVTDEIASATMVQNITACTLIPSAITTDRTIENTGFFYIVKGNDLVPIAATATLTIEPGVTIVFDGAVVGFEAYGRIVAEGTPGEKIRFRGNTCGASSGLWDGIYLQGGSCTAVFKNAEIGTSSNGIQVLDGASLTLDECVVYDNTSMGISVLTDASTAHIRSCSIWDNGIGIEIENATVDITSSAIQFNTSNGIEISHSFPELAVTIDSTIIANNGDIGILLSGLSAPAIHYCSISSNGDEGGAGYAIRLAGHAGSDTIHAENNYWGLGNTTRQKIEAVIYDGNDQFGLAYVEFDPWLSESPLARMASFWGTAKERSWERSSR